MISVDLYLLGRYMAKGFSLPYTYHVGVVLFIHFAEPLLHKVEISFYRQPERSFDALQLNQRVGYPNAIFLTGDRKSVV